jgi:hypothetical protein
LAVRRRGEALEEEEEEEEEKKTVMYIHAEIVFYRKWKRADGRIYIVYMCSRGGRPSNTFFLLQFRQCSI